MRAIPCSLHVANALDQSGDAEDVGRAAFEEIGQFARLRLAGRIAAGAALAPRRHARSRTGVQETCPGRAQQRFVAGRGQQIDVHVLDVDGHDAGRLGRVDQEEQIVFAGNAANLGDRLHGAEHVAGVRQGDEARFACVMALRTSSGSMVPPPSAVMRVSVMRPANSIARSGRLTLLCSRLVVMT